VNDGERVVIVPPDELLARPHIVAWLAYPLNPRFRERAIEATRDFARWRARMPLTGRKARTEDTLRQLAKELDRSLLAGEVFRRQVLDRQHPSMFGPSSTRQFAYRLTEWRGAAQSTNTRDFWSKRRPVLALAAGACDGLHSRPSLVDLLFGDREWAGRCLAQAERWRQLAIETGHEGAPQLRIFRAGEP
jgi:hypothetical protein